MHAQTHSVDKHVINHHVFIHSTTSAKRRYIYLFSTQDVHSGRGFFNALCMVIIIILISLVHNF